MNDESPQPDLPGRRPLHDDARGVVWLLEDSPMHAEAVRRALAPQHRLEVFDDGTTLLERLAAGTRPDIVLLDWLLPGISGIETLRFLRARYDESALPVLMLTVQTAKTDVAEGLSVGANDYLAKPYDPLELQARVRTLLRTRRLCARAGRPRERVVELVRPASRARDEHRRLRGQYAIARVLAEESTLAAAAPRLLGAICETFDWPFGELWTLGPDARTLRTAASWHGADPVIAHFAEASRAFTFAPGAGLPGRVWSSGEPAWVTDVARDAEFFRAALAARAGLGAALAFPLVVDGAVAGVLEFFAREARAPDRDLLEALTAAGRQIAQFVARERAVAQLRASEARMNALFERAQHELFHAEEAAPARAPVDLAAVVRAAVEVLRPVADAKGVRVELALDPGTGELSGDAARLQRVAWNLLANAIKFTPRGGHVAVCTQRTDAWVELLVSDTGVGIAPDALPYVFLPFRQQDASATGQHTGLALGLAIVKHLVESHGGTVTARSDGQGMGATFLVRLPGAPRG